MFFAQENYETMKNLVADLKSTVGTITQGKYKPADLWNRI